MKKKLLWMLAVISICFSQLSPSSLPQQKNIAQGNQLLAQLISPKPPYEYSRIPVTPMREIEAMLRKESPALSPAVANKVMTSLKCADRYNINHNEILTVIDYSLPSSEKRLWVFNLRQKKLLYHTYVSHGIRSGALLTKYFSNKYDSKASSIGVYTTEKSYHGRDGLSLQLAGLDSGFNDNAANRAVVMHGGWYVDEQFIKRYGRPGRSWGCPALPLDLTSSIINTIKDKSFLVIYYPSDNWFVKSKFLNCENFSRYELGVNLEDDVNPPLHESREGILYVDMNRNHSRQENEPVVVISSDRYEQIFHSRAPLERMLRRQINQKEYIALTESEFKRVMLDNQNASRESWQDIYFVVPDVKLQRGYYITQMRVVDLGTIEDVKFDSDSSARETSNGFTVKTSNKELNLRLTDQFIRWLGL
ncbi:hypothetical protein EAS68_12875 [Legionella jordanis]|uniref:murein L,D-transpeptidase catalytic domain family protein n=1 Tax=Legionella jordanis TaxID=456 RepID=UPI000F00DAF0|nr:murein L,D-transpeptidase catalytic domain family protein [Legionella jordanis]RMX15121.1 hypothetical protein EAS68_12875 [Legionella jordanis]